MKLRNLKRARQRLHYPQRSPIVSYRLRLYADESRARCVYDSGTQPFPG